MKNMRNTAKFSAIVLSLVLLLGALPAFAATEGAADAPATREYVIAAFAEAAGLEGTASLDGFIDARDVSASYAEGIAKAVAAGVVKGYEDGTLRPKESISRAEALVLLSRCLPELDAVRDATAFRDVPAWAKADIDRLSAAGLVAGCGDGVLGASDALSVAQVGMLTERVIGGDLPSTILHANAPEAGFARHSNVFWQDDFYSKGEIIGSNKYYATPQSVYLDFANGYIIDYITADSFIRYCPEEDEDCVRLLLTPEENAAALASYQGYLVEMNDEILESVREKDGELLVSTRYEVADSIREELELYRTSFGEKFETVYEDGMAEILTYRLDAASLELKGMSVALRLADGSEIPLFESTYDFDVELPDPAAADSVFAPAFDESKGRREITLVFDAGTEAEQTHTYSVPNTIQAQIYYHGQLKYIYDDPACTIPFSGVNGRTAFTAYITSRE